MTRDTTRLELTAKDFELLEAALHTQKKILALQSEAGGTGSHRRLADLSHLMARVGRARATGNPPAGASWRTALRSFLLVGNRCA